MYLPEVKAYDVIIIGGGLSGLTAALHLSKNHLEVLVIEKQKYPHHKVCGEYLSNEIKPYLNTLGIGLTRAVNIDTFQLSTVNGGNLISQLPLGGMGISRYALDESLYLKAVENGVTIVFDSVSSVDFTNNNFKVITVSEKEYTAELVIGAYGKRSSLDKVLGRNFIKKKSPWLGVKAHYHFPDFPDNLVALHNFSGGYAGISKTETGAVNFCYLANYKSFAQYKEISHFNNNILTRNPFLEEFLSRASPLFEKPLSIAQISFESKPCVERHMLMCGDTAGLIHPLCGNGMAMAIHSAKIAAELIIDYFKVKDFSRKTLELKYSKSWNATFGKRIRSGRRLQTVLLHSVMGDKLMQLAIKSPKLVQRIIKSTHGKPITN